MKILKKIGIIALWVVIWQVAALIIHNSVLFAGPIETIKSLFGLLGDGEFISSVLSSYVHIMGGILIGVILGVLLGIASYKISIVKDLLSPIAQVVKAVPVASFAVLVLIWFGSGNVSTVISALVVFPIVYTSVLEGVSASAADLLEMAYVYRMPRFNQVRYIYLPSLVPFFKSSLSLSIGMGFKSGVAAEVIGQSALTMGNGLYKAKVLLDTSELFAWTFTIVLVSYITEKIITGLITLLGGKGAKGDN